MEIDMQDMGNQRACDGGPAFPVGVRVVHQDGKGGHVVHEAEPGMTLRDYFAAKAMQGMMADPEFDPPPAEAAERAYRVADAMIKERES